jgi:probable addiction module antidote protein
LTRTLQLPFDAAEYLETEEDIASYLKEVFEIGDADLIAAAIAIVARARGINPPSDAA